MTGLATYHSTKRVKAGKIIRVHPDTNACVVRAEDGGEIRIPIHPPHMSLAQVGGIYVEDSHGGQFFYGARMFNALYASRASNL